MNWKYKEILNSEDILGKIEKDGLNNFADNLNDYIDYNWFNEKIKGLEKIDDIKGQMESKGGRFVEELVLFLFQKYIKENKIKKWKVFHQSDKSIDNSYFFLQHKKKDLKKKFDIDIFITNKDENKWYLLSVKGSVRERIGQFIATLFLLDDRIIKEKYNDEWFLNHKKNGKKIKYGLINLDWSGETKDFQKYTNKNGKKRKSVKEVEIELIDNDHYVGGKVSSFNNYENFDKVINFSTLCGEISKFFNQK